jgi:hypothetical protein
MGQQDADIDLYCYEKIWGNDVVRIKRPNAPSTDENHRNPTIFTVLAIADIAELLLVHVVNPAKYMLAQSCREMADIVSTLKKHDWHRRANSCMRLAKYCVQTPSLLDFFMTHTIKNCAGEIECENCMMDSKKLCKFTISKKLPAQLVQAYNAGCHLARDSLEVACASGVLSSVRTLVSYEKRQQQEYNPLTFTLLRDDEDLETYTNNGFLKTKQHVSNVLVETARGGNVHILKYLHLFTDVQALVASSDDNTVERMYQMAAMCGNKNMLEAMFDHDSFRYGVHDKNDLAIGKLLSVAITVRFLSSCLVSCFFRSPAR